MTLKGESGPPMWSSAQNRLAKAPDLTVAPITSSCCGMAGAFGYQSETQDVARAMAEADLLPAVRKAKPGS